MRFLLRPTPPPDPETVQLKLTADVMTGVDKMRPIFDAADGMRADMRARGWTEAAAEAAALTWLQGMLALATKAVTR